MHAPTTRRLLLLSTTLTLLAAGGSCLAEGATMLISVSGSHFVDDREVAGIGISREAASGTVRGGHGLGDPHVNAGLSASASPGRVFASAAGYASYGGPAPAPWSLSVYHGAVNAQFYDHLTITGRHGTVLPDTMRIRLTWRTTGGYFYEDPDPAGWGGTGMYWARKSGHAVSGAKGRHQYGQPLLDGTPSGNTVFTEESLTAATGYMLEATASADAWIAPYVDLGAVAGYARASGHCSMELMGIEVFDDATGVLLAVNVTGDSGHVYPVAQPPEPWMPTTPHLTAHAINPETGSVMLSFASQGGVTYRVKASRDMGRTDPWQVISTHTGQPGATLATFIDPDAMTQSSRFFIIERD